MKHKIDKFLKLKTKKMFPHENKTKKLNKNQIKKQAENKEKIKMFLNKHVYLCDRKSDGIVRLK